LKKKLTKFILLAAIAIISTNSYSQKNIHVAISTDSVFLLAESIQNINPDSAIHILNLYLYDTLAISKADIWKKNDIICMAYINTGRFAKADSLATQNINYITNKRQEAATYLMLGRTSIRIKNGQKKSLIYFKKAAEASRAINDTNDLSRALVNLGYSYADFGATAKASTVLLEAIKINEVRGDIVGVAHAKGALGRVYSEVDEDKKALEYYQGAINNFKQIGNKQALISFYINAANALGMLKEYEKELRVLDSATLVNNELNNIHFTIVINYNEALALFNLSKFNASEILTNNTIKIIQKSNIRTYEYGRLLGLKAKINIKLRNYSEALDYLTKALSKALENNDLQGQYNMYIDLNELYTAQKKYKLANKNLVKSIEIHKKLRSAEKDKAVKNLEFVYETEKKEQIIEIQNIELQNRAIALENEKIKKYFLLVSLFFVVIVFIVFFVYQRKAQRRKEEAEQSRKEKEIARYKLLVVNNQISPHFTFNAINSLQGLIAGEEKDKALDAFSKFANLIKATLQGADSYTNSLKDEIEFIGLFLEFMKFKYNDKFNYTLDIDPNVDKSFIIPRLAIQELVENSIKHGIRHKTTNDGFVKIDINQTEDYYVFTVIDNGVGIKKAKELHTLGTGKGVYINNMINNIFNKNNERPTIKTFEDVIDMNGIIGGTKAVLKIPTEYKFEM